MHRTRLAHRIPFLLITSLGLSLLSPGVFAGDDVTMSPLVIGGEDVEAGDVPPWLANMRLRTSRIGVTNPYCAATRIHEHWAMTAAHCIISDPLDPDSGKPLEPDDLYLQFNQRDYRSAVRRSEGSYVERWVIAPGYSDNGREYDADIALLKLRDASSLGGGVVGLAGGYSASDSDSVLKETVEPRNDDLMTLMGWGLTADPPPEPRDSVLQRLDDLPVVGRGQCQTIWGGVRITGNMICTGFLDGPDDPPRTACRGDSGGPIFYRDSASGRDVQTGVVSFGTRVCGDTRRSSGRDIQAPDVHANVAAYAGWIDTVQTESQTNPLNARLIPDGPLEVSACSRETVRLAYTPRDHRSSGTRVFNPRLNPGFLDGRVESHDEVNSAFEISFEVPQGADENLRLNVMLFDNFGTRDELTVRVRVTGDDCGNGKSSGGDSSGGGGGGGSLSWAGALLLTTLLVTDGLRRRRPRQGNVQRDMLHVER